MKPAPRFTRHVLAASMAAAGLYGFAWADEGADDVRRLTRPHSEIELGLGHVGSGSYKFGDFRGLGESGGYAIANLGIVRRGENDTGYLIVNGSNLGLDSRNLRIEAGQQGDFGLRFEYDQLPKLFSDSYQTPYVDPGHTTLRLPDGWVEANGTAGMTQLGSSMRDFDVETMRKSVGLGLTKYLPAGWRASLSFKREKKDGNRFIGAVIGNSGGNPRAAILPEPVDYTTDQVEATARYTTRKLQLQLGYYGSFFRNDNAALAWQNPYANAPGNAWGNPAVGYSGGGFGQIGLPPDNDFHQISASGGYNLSRHTRIAGKLSFGRMTQDDPFLPYSINPGLSVTTPMPRASLDGRIDTTHASVKLSSRPAPRLHLTAAYRFDDRDNRTPQAQYLYIGGDSMDQRGVASAQARVNLPGSSTKHQLHAEADYRLAGGTKLSFGYEYDRVKKTFEPIDSEEEHTVEAGVHHHFAGLGMMGVRYEHSARSTSDYNGAAPVLASYSPEYMATLAPELRWDDLPGMKKFFLADRNRDKLHAFLAMSPGERVDLQLGVDYHQDRYPDSEFGLEKTTGWMANVDASFRATDEVSAHMFATYEDYGSDQNSRQYSGGGAKAGQSADPNRNWSMSASDRTLTLGLGFRFKPEGRYEFGGDLSHADSRGKIRFEAGSALTALPLPDLVTRLDRLELFGRYWLRQDVSLNLRYIYEQYLSRDWAYDEVLPATLANVIGTNQASPDYEVHMLGVSVSYRFYY
jgi:MtrB/PioB family decaheme-associated outer membrane protein